MAGLKGWITVKVFAGFMLLLVGMGIGLYLINESLKKHGSLINSIDCLTSNQSGLN